MVEGYGPAGSLLAKVRRAASRPPSVLHDRFALSVLSVLPLVRS
jgi:hypothetical protein